jgi:hypothetical protein
MTRWGPYAAGELAVRYGFFAVQCLGLGGILFALVSLIPFVSRRTILLQPAPHSDRLIRVSVPA